MIKSFKRLNLSIIVALAVAVSSCSNEANAPVNGETGEFHAVIAFEGSIDATRAGSSYIPSTSWSNINNAQVFLIDGSGNVKYSKTISVPTSGTFNDIWTDVPVGTYTVSVVANVDNNTDDIHTSLDGGATNTLWDSYNVRQKNLTDLVMYLKGATFPAHASSYTSQPKSSPSEVFMGSVDNIAVSTGSAATASVSLKREVSLMRVRVNQVAGTDAADVDFKDANASIMYHRVPKGLTILDGTTGGVITGSSDANATVVAATGASTFLDSDPAGGQVIDADYKLWRDVIVLPNSDTRNVNTVSTDRQYTIVISGQAPAGHKLADNTVLSAPATVYWSGLIKDSFTPNTIREVNLEVKTGGSTEIPGIREEGSLTINVSAPEPWDSNILETDIIL